VLFHLLEEFGVLRLCDLFVPDAHMSVVAGYPPHSHVGHVEKRDIVLIYLELIFLQKVKIEQLPVLLRVVVLKVRCLIVFPVLHLLLLADGVLEDPPRWRADISEVINRESIVTPNDRVVHKLYLGLIL
jgi:hypothetical protein